MLFVSYHLTRPNMMRFEHFSKLPVRQVNRFRRPRLAAHSYTQVLETRHSGRDRRNLGSKDGEIRSGHKVRHTVYAFDKVDFGDTCPFFHLFLSQNGTFHTFMNFVPD